MQPDAARGFSHTGGFPSGTSLRSVCHRAVQGRGQPGSPGWHVPRHCPAEAWEPQEGTRQPPLLLFVLRLGGQTPSLAPATPSSSDALGASDSTGDAGTSRAPSKARACGWLGDAERPEQEIFLPLPWHCRPAVPQSFGVEQRLPRQKPGRRVTVSWSRRDSLWSWNAAGPSGGSVPGAGAAPLRAEPSSEAGCCARMLLGCADPPAIPVRGAAALAEDVGTGVPTYLPPPWHEPGRAAPAVSGSRKELCLPNPAQGCIRASHEAEERNRLPPKYRGDVEKSTESSQGWKKTILGFSWIQPLSRPRRVPGCSSSQVQALVPGQWLCPGLKVGGAGKRHRLGRGHGPCPGWGHSEMFLGESPRSVCGCPGGRGSVGRGALRAGGLCQAVKQGRAPNHWVWGFFFCPISSKAIPGRAFTRFLR